MTWISEFISGFQIIGVVDQQTDIDMAGVKTLEQEGNAVSLIQRNTLSVLVFRMFLFLGFLKTPATPGETLFDD